MADYERSQAAFPELVTEWRGASERVYKLQYGGGVHPFLWLQGVGDDGDQSPTHSLVPPKSWRSWTVHSLTRCCCQVLFRFPGSQLEPRATYPTPHPPLQMPATTLVVDNGSYTIKAGFTTGKTCITIPNCIARTRDKRVLIGQQLENCRDFGSAVFRRPVEKVWRKLFAPSDTIF